MLNKQNSRQGRDPIPESNPVPVGANGQPAQELPQEAVYARMAEQAVAAEEQRNIIGDQPPAGTPDQAMDGSVAPPVAPADPTPQPESASPKAEARIRQLVDELRQKEQELQGLSESSKRAQDLEQKLRQLEEQHQQMMQANLDHLDPDERMRVLAEAQISQRFDQMQQRLLETIGPQLQALQSKQQRDEVQALSERYPSFDYEIHGKLIDTYRGKNPNSSIEQAWRAIATDDELLTRSQAQVSSVPPVLPPGSSDLSAARYAQEPEQPSNPQDELVDEAQRIAQLRRSSDPADQKKGMQMLHEHLKRRLS